jgi:rhodanese-related sulfurtransferase
MTLRTLTPQEAKRLIDQGAVLVDIREADEHARERIPGARNIALSRLDHSEFATEGSAIILHCRSGARTMSNAARLAAKAGPDCEAYMVEGGLDAWRRAGLPTLIDLSAPIDIQRQVMIVAGSLVALGTMLGLTVSPWLFGVPLFVGCGLTFAGITGICGMARLLAYAPWNNQAGAVAR